MTWMPDLRWLRITGPTPSRAHARLPLHSPWEANRARSNGASGVGAGGREEPGEWRQGLRLRARPGKRSALLPGPDLIFSRKGPGLNSPACMLAARGSSAGRTAPLNRGHCTKACPGAREPRADLSTVSSALPQRRLTMRGPSASTGALLLGLRTTASPAVITGLKAGGHLTRPLAAPGSRPAPT